VMKAKVERTEARIEFMMMVSCVVRRALEQAPCHRPERALRSHFCPDFVIRTAVLLRDRQGHGA
jgi:hypothetical protein